MLDLQSMGRMLLLVGVIIVIIGGLFLLLGRVPFLGQLPGDIRVQRGNWGCYIPLATSILLSIILTIVLNILARVLNK